MKVDKQFRALFFKNLALQKRARWSTLVQLFVPVFLLSILFIVQVVIDDNFKSEVSADIQKNRTLYSQKLLDVQDPQIKAISESASMANLTFDISTIARPRIFNLEHSPLKDVSWSMRCTNDKSRDFTWGYLNVCYMDPKNFIIASAHGRHFREVTFNYFYELPVMWVVYNSNIADLVGNLTYTGEHSGLLGDVYGNRVHMSIENRKGWYFPFFKRVSSEELAMKQLADLSRAYNKEKKSTFSLKDVWKRTFYLQTRDFYQSLHRLQDLEMHRFEKYKPHSVLVIRNLKLDKLRKNYTFEKLEKVKVKLNETTSSNTTNATLPLKKTIFRNITVNGTLEDIRQNNFTLKEMEVEIIGLDDAMGKGWYHLQRRSEMLTMLTESTLKGKRQKHFGIRDDMSYSYVNNDYRKGFSSLIQLYMLPLYIDDFSPVDISSFGGGFAFAFSASFLLPLFLSNVVRDKQEKHLIMMRLCGLKPVYYWGITFIYYFTVYLMVISCVIGFSVLFQFKIFVQTSYAVLFLLYFLWGVALIVMSFFLSTFFDKQRTAAVVGYLLVIGGVITSNFIDQLMIYPEDSFPSFWYMGYPPFAFYRSLRLIESACTRLACLQSSDLLNNAVFIYGLNCLVGSTLVLGLLTSYLVNITPHQFGIRKSYFFFVPLYLRNALWKLVSLVPNHKRAHQRTVGEDEEEERLINLSLQPVDPSESDPNTSTEMYPKDELVASEEDSITRGVLNSSNCSVVISNAVKIYESHDVVDRYSVLRGLTCGYYQGKPRLDAKAAVKNLSLALRKNECLGLLGANGAGKTTLISLITGMFEATEGKIEIGGYEIREFTKEVNAMMGVCPQFDIFHPTLTVKEHLLFYCRLRGVSRVQESVSNILGMINLVDVCDRMVKDLSGGMRRRLSIGISLCGNPSVLVLDEPTTGLDPLSRRAVWKVLENVKKDRSVLITTHAMDEADHLCDRVAIMAKGELKCLGSPARLKRVYGQGYTLLVHFETVSGRFSSCSSENGECNLDETDERMVDCSSHLLEQSNQVIQRDRVINFILSTFDGTSISESHNDSCLFLISREKVDPSFIFKQLKANKRNLKIVDWGLSITTLENVFLNVIGREDNYS
eukprot:Nk52_evm20s370 gene=Nk52_evmTU20s370